MDRQRSHRVHELQSLREVAQRRPGPASRDHPALSGSCEDLPAVPCVSDQRRSPALVGAPEPPRRALPGRKIVLRKSIAERLQLPARAAGEVAPTSSPNPDSKQAAHSPGEKPRIGRKKSLCNATIAVYSIKGGNSPRGSGLCYLP